MREVLRVEPVLMCGGEKDEEEKEEREELEESCE